MQYVISGILYENVMSLYKHIIMKHTIYTAYFKQAEHRWRW